MPAFTYPGVYIEELPSGVHTITGVATSIAAFIGWARQGPTTQATLVESWSEYQTLFGGLDARSKLGYAVNQFFANGGQQAYIVRLVWDGTLPAAPNTVLTPCATAVASGIGFAATRITATVGAITSPPLTLSVGTPVLQSITVTPANLPPIPIGASINLSATGNFSDGSTSALSTVTWSSGDTGVIAITSGGVATGMGQGTAILTASSGIMSGSVPVTVTPAGLTGIAVTPATVTLADGQAQQLTATGSYADGTSQDLTAVAAWATSDSTEVALDPTGIPGLVRAGSTAGAANITATWVTVVGTAKVTAAAKAVSALAIYPANLTSEESKAVDFTAIATSSDGTSATLAGGTWSSSNPTVATIDPNTGVATTTAVPGSATITVSSGSAAASATLTVTAATLSAISVTPLNATVAVGTTLALKALGIYSDGTTADLTRSAQWTSSSTDAPVDTNAGIVTGHAADPSVTITATSQGVHGATTVAVTPAVLASIAVTAATPSILSGQTDQLTATGTYTDGSTSDITATAAWSSSATAVATVNGSGLAKAIASGGSLTLFANNPGAWGNSLYVSVTPQPADGTRFGLTVQLKDPNGQLNVLESYFNLSANATDPLYAVTVIDNDSNYVSFINPATNMPVTPAAAPSPTPAPIALSGGADGSVLTPASDQNFELALLNSAGGVNLLTRVPIFNLLCVPAETDAPTIQQLQAFCVQERAFQIVDAPQLSTTAGLTQTGPVGSGSGSVTEQNSINSAYYYPWISAPDPLFGNRPTLFPPCGFVAGIYAATDAGVGVWKAPAGINAGLTGVLGLQYNLTDQENGDLNTQGINCLRQFRVYGDVVWGARTLQGSDQAGSQWKYVPIRRLALYIESSLYEGTQWAVFEPNDERLWGQLRLSVGTFMQGLFLQGAFQGTTPQQAYFVKCDAENNPQFSIDQGIVTILVGFAPLYPAEFVVVQIQQMAGQSS